MVVKKPRIVIIGAGMSGLVAANKLYTAKDSRELFELCVVEGGTRIGGRINTSEFEGDRIELGATWIHGIGGSPIHKIAEEIHALEAKQPWEDMDGSPENVVTMSESGFEIDLSVVDPILLLYRKMMEFAQGKIIHGNGENGDAVDYYRVGAKAIKTCSKPISLGSFLRKSLNAYWDSVKDQDGCNSSGKLLEEAIFAMMENAERAHTSAGDLSNLDYNAESEYLQFPDEEITIAKGYLSIIESLASVLPDGLIQLGRKVTKIEWQPDGHGSPEIQNGGDSRPVKLHFADGSIMVADHVINTVSLGVLKAGIQEESGMFSPPLPSFKTEAITRLGFGVVNKLFLQLDPMYEFPFLQMAFHRSDSGLRNQKIPWWMRRTSSLCPIYKNSSVLLSWFAGREAVELESLNDEEIINGVSTTISNFLSKSEHKNITNLSKCSNGNGNSFTSSHGFKFTKVQKSKWGTDPLFMGSYSYVAVGSSGDDLDSMAEPLPMISDHYDVAPLQILFAGEATHRTQYSTTHGAYFSGVREANRLLQHYHCSVFSELQL
ncbi:hypothetical protein GIB67_026385 [Kingdonia uniflora]|uniref:Amine oxidase domain-containing protein n=1 Tax=Kingdonia uniflora TaxID=39325 RepID=A0A7J7P615_9MAGN|nr:hypothetical protein GIB67_026385 [Kingdonia uniflora]